MRLHGFAGSPEPSLVACAISTTILAGSNKTFRPHNFLALDLCVALMELHEEAVIATGYKYAWGELGR